MDRIEELLENLVSLCESVSFWTNRYSALLDTTTGVGDMPLDKAHENLQGYRSQRDAIRQQIADEWRGMYEALEAAVTTMNEFGNITNWPPEMPRAYADAINEGRAALARARGES